jgi:hypothetical protein
MRRWCVSALGLPILIAAAAQAGAQTREVTGQAGILAEWDLNATVTEQTKGRWTGPLRMTHVGLCGVDGPEEKTGELQLLMSEPAGEVAATLLIDGEACTFSGRLKDGGGGLMHCPERPDVPMMLQME